ncbi:MAG: sugar transferase [Acidobacteria bacterium]|nr:sugar transferase [Acidobacteriota bacterium]
MFREHARLFAALQFAGDLVLTCLAFLLAYFTRIHAWGILPRALERFLNPELMPPGSYAWIILLGTAWWTVTAYSLGLYRPSVRRHDWQKVRVVLESSLLLGLFIGFLSFALKLDLSRFLIALFVFYQAAFLLLARAIVGLQARLLHRQSLHQRNIVIIGTNPKALEMGRLITMYSDWGLRVLGHVEAGAGSDPPSGPPVLGAVADLPEIIENNVVDEIIIVGADARDLEGLDEVLAICKEQGIRMRVAVDLFPAKITKVSMEFLENVPVITFSATPEHAFALLVKRVLDVLVSVLLLLFLLPFLMIVGVLVKVTSSGPVIYRQVRCGLYGRRFLLYKFRSMYEGAEDVLWEIKHLNEMDGPVFKMRNDPRVTPFGRFLRKSSIDELPQLWNVLKGDMSLVGPRAPLPEEVREYTRWQRRRLSVKPGITCLWQVSGRSEIDFHEWMKLDLQYIDNWSLLLDFKILLRTFPVVLLGKGAR